jgi:tRNA(Ile)-lysidine synthase
MGEFIGFCYDVPSGFLFIGGCLISMQKLLQNVFSQLKQLVPEPCHFVLGYSGGVDSRVLLEIVQRFVRQYPDYSLEAVYIHHGLSAHADAWADHCQHICQTLDVPCSVERVVIDRDSPDSLENMARQARYDVFRRKLAPESVLLTAHHQDDQLETLLLALKRGAGPRGLAGMLPKTGFAAGYLVRPLLSASRQSILQWAMAQHLVWIEDESNQDQQFDRNFLRQTIIPQLKNRWPEIAETAERSAALCAEEELVLADYLAADYAALVDSRLSFPIEPLRLMSAARRHQLLRFWLRDRTGTVPSLHQLDLIWQEVALAAQDANPCLHWAKGDVRRYQDRLYHVTSVARDALSAQTGSVQLDDMAGELVTSAGILSVGVARSTPDSVAGQQQITVWLPQDARISVQYQLPGSVRVHPQERSHSRELKKIWQEYGIPPWLRAGWPCLCVDGQVIAIPGVLIAQHCAHEQENSVAHEYFWQPIW